MSSEICIPQFELFNCNIDTMIVFDNVNVSFIVIYSITLLLLLLLTIFYGIKRRKISKFDISPIFSCVCQIAFNAIMLRKDSPYNIYIQLLKIILNVISNVLIVSSLAHYILKISSYDKYSRTIEKGIIIFYLIINLLYIGIINDKLYYSLIFIKSIFEMVCYFIWIILICYYIIKYDFKNKVLLIFAAIIYMTFIFSMNIFLIIFIEQIIEGHPEIWIIYDTTIKMLQLIILYGILFYKKHKLSLYNMRNSDGYIA